MFVGEVPAVRVEFLVGGVRRGRSQDSDTQGLGVAIAECAINADDYRVKCDPEEVLGTQFDPVPELQAWVRGYGELVNAWDARDRDLCDTVNQVRHDVGFLHATAGSPRTEVVFIRWAQG